VSELPQANASRWLEMELAVSRPVAARNHCGSGLRFRRDKRQLGAVAIAAALLLMAPAALADVRARDTGAGWRIGEHELRSESGFFVRTTPRNPRMGESKTNIDIEMPRAIGCPAARGLCDPLKESSRGSRLPRGDDARTVGDGEGSAVASRHLFSRSESRGRTAYLMEHASAEYMSPSRHKRPHDACWCSCE